MGRRADLRKTLVALSRAVVNGQVPDDYQEYPVSRMPAYTPASDVRLTPERQFVGNHLRVVRYPTPMIPRKTDPNSPIADEIVTFFGNGLPIATPTAFMVNVNTLKAYPLTQGVMDIPALESRMASLIQADMDNVDPKTLPPMPASAQVTPQ